MENSIEKDEEILNNIKTYMQENIDKGWHKFVYNDLGCHEKCIDIINAIETVLSELEKKDKVINEMSNFINLMSNELVAETGDNNLEFCKMQKCKDNGELDCEECIKEYFTKKAEKEGIKE